MSSSQAKYVKLLLTVALTAFAYSRAWSQATVLNQQFLQGVGSGANYYLIATTAQDNVNGLDHLHILATFNCNDASLCNSTIDATFGNRAGFNGVYTAKGASPTGLNVHLVAYRQSDTTTNIYISMADYYDVASYSVIENVEEVVYSNPTNTGSATPAGTLVFDSASTTYLPANWADFSGDLTVNGTLTMTPTSGGKITFADGTQQTTAFTSAALSTIPLSSIQIAQALGYGLGPHITLNNPAGGSGAGGSIDFQGFSPAAQPIQARISYVDDGAWSSSIIFWTKAYGSYGALVERMRVGSTGNIGIGTSTPSAALEVNGNLKLTQNSGASITFPDTTVQSTAWNGTTLGGDYAESVDVLGGKTDYAAGDVLIIDATHPGRFTKSAVAYTKLVAGVFSTKPGLTGRRVGTSPGGAGDVPMALVGIVPTKVCDEGGPVEPGDFLVSSSKAGYAMKGTDSAKMNGAVIGKALAPLTIGIGTIEVLLNFR